MDALPAVQVCHILSYPALAGGVMHFHSCIASPLRQKWQIVLSDVCCNSYPQFCVPSLPLFATSLCRQGYDPPLSHPMLSVVHCADARGTLAVHVLFIRQGAAVPTHIIAAKVVQVTEPVMQKLTGVDTSEGVEAVAEVELPPGAELTASSGWLNLACWGVAALCNVVVKETQCCLQVNHLYAYVPLP